MEQNRTFFITSVCWERRPIFRDPELATSFIETLYANRAKGNLLLHEFVIMPDHVHLLITPKPTLALERVMQFLKGGFSHKIRQERKIEIWQPSFTNHRVRDEEDYIRHRGYIRGNPVRAKLVERPEDYPYSSASPGFDLDPMPQRLKPGSR